MPIFFKVYEEHGLFISSWDGAVSDCDLLPSYKQLFENEKYRPGFHEIADLRQAQMTTVTGEGLRQLNSMVAQYLAGKCEGFKTAVIAPRDLPFALARQYEAYSSESPESVMVFREVSEALKWIGVDDSSIE